MFRPDIINNGSYISLSENTYILSKYKIGDMLKIVNNDTKQTEFCVIINFLYGKDEIISSLVRYIISVDTPEYFSEPSQCHELISFSDKKYTIDKLN